MSDHAGQGKIQRAPRQIREALNHRLMDGQLGPQVLPWLNALAEIKAICANHFAGEEVTSKNLSDYRTGAYAKWLKQRASIEKQKELNLYALDIVKGSGRNLSSAAASLAAGRLLEAIEKIGDEETPPEELVSAIAELRKGDIKEKEIDLKASALDQKERELDLREEQTAWAVTGKIKKALESRELQAIADNVEADDEAKMKDILRITFGDPLLQRMEARRAAAQGG